MIKKALVAVFTVVLSATCYAQPDRDSRVETIDVMGEKTTPQLKREFKAAKADFLLLYNRVNEQAQFDVICKWRKTIGSQIARKYCEPRYVKEARALWIQRVSPFPGIDFNRLPSDDTLRWLVKDQREAAYEHVAALVMTNPELLESFTRLDTIYERIEGRKNQ